MQAVILAGGLGVRLRPVTLTTPKPMVPVNGRPFVEYLITLLHRQGLDDIVFLAGYLGDQLERHFRDGRDWSVRIRYSHESKPLGTAGALVNADELLEPEFLLLNGDTYLDTDYAAMMRMRRTRGAAVVMAVYDNPEGIATNNVTITEAGYIVEYRKGNGGDMTHVDAGAYALSKEVVTALRAGEVLSLESAVFPLLAKQGRLMAWPVADRFYDIGTFDRLDLAHRVLS